MIYCVRHTVLLNQTNSFWQYIWFAIGYVGHVLIKKNEKIRNIVWNNITMAVALSGLIASFAIYWKHGLNEYLICSIAVVTIIVLLGNISRLCNTKFTMYIGDIGKNTLPIYAIHWCLFFAPNLYENMYQRVYNTELYILNVLFSALSWLVLSLSFIWLMRRFKITKVILLGEK